MVRGKISLAGLFLIWGLTSFTPPPADALLQRLIVNLNRFKTLRAQEKVYLRLAKPYYTAGDTAWFRAWQVWAANNQPATSSKVLYAELLAPNGQLLLSRKIRMEAGAGAGDFILPDTLSSGLYQVRAYTNWMRNFDESFLFTQNIPVYNPAQPVNVIRQPVNLAGAGATGLQFFPESGHLLAGIPTRVAVRATNADGSPATVKCNIQDRSGTKVASFATRQNGVGSFVFTPEEGQTYVAIPTSGSLPVVEKALPAVQPQGIGLTLRTNPDSYAVTISATTNFPSQANLLLVAEAHDSIYYATRLNLQNQLATISVPKNSLPAGIIQWVVFSPEGQPLAERLCFAEGPKLQVKITSDKPVYAPKEKVTLNITVTDQQNRPVAVNLALMVNDKNQFPDSDVINRNLRSYLLLEADLSEPIMDPDYYFREGTPAAMAALDELMLTQTWRRFSWAQLAQGQLPEIPYEFEEGISLKGKLTDAAGRPRSKNMLMVSVLHKERGFRNDFTEDDGSFYFGGFDFDNTVEVIFQPYRSSQNNIGKVTLDTVRLPALERPTLLQPLAVGSGFTRYLQKTDMRQQIAEAWGENAPDTTNQIHGVSSPDASTAKRTINIDYVPDETILVDRYINFSSVPELIKELVPGVMVSRRKKAWRFRVLNRHTKLYYKGEPLYIIDKVPVYDQAPILNLDPASIYSIELIATPDKLAAFGQLGFNGVIIINTKNNDFYPNNNGDALKLRVSGYHPPRPFYLPTYHSLESPTNAPDLRPLIYWNPSVQTDASGHVTVSFYNSDDITQFRVFTEGVSPDGKIAVGSYHYQVALPKR